MIRIISLLAGMCFSLNAVCQAAEETIRTPEQIRAVVDGMVKPDVAWRVVKWKTCLLDGIQESQRTGKPIMLWIFIDRPIDDERC